MVYIPEPLLQGLIVLVLFWLAPARRAFYIMNILELPCTS